MSVFFPHFQPNCFNPLRSILPRKTHLFIDPKKVPDDLKLVLKNDNILIEKYENIGHFLAQLVDWTIIDQHHLGKTYRFPDFATALAFVNRVGALAEAEDHHPDIELGWGRVALKIWTHSIGGLSRNDFILAAKIDETSREL